MLRNLQPVDWVEAEEDVSDVAVFQAVIKLWMFVIFPVFSENLRMLLYCKVFNTPEICTSNLVSNLIQHYLQPMLGH